MVLVGLQLDNEVAGEGERDEVTWCSTMECLMCTDE